MFEETNQAMEQEAQGAVQETTAELPDSLFGDEGDAAETTPGTQETAEQRNDTRETAAEEENSAGDTRDTAATPQTVKIKYNGEEKEIPLDEAVKLAQKGMNYDHVKQELDDYRQGKQGEVPILAEYARRSGMEYNAYVTMLESNAAGYAQEQARNEVRNQFPDADDDVLEELAAARARLTELERRESQDKQRREETDRRLKPWREFMKKFPDVDSGKLPEEVIHAIRDGATPIEAYQAHLISELKHEKQIADQNTSAKQRAVGSAKGDAAEEEKDAFLAGFNG